MHKDENMHDFKKYIKITVTKSAHNTTEQET